MPRQRLPARVKGPYYLAARDKWRIRIIDAGRIEDVFFDSEAAAKKAIETAAKKLTTVSRILGHVLEEYIAEKERHGSAKPETCVQHLANLRMFFAEHLNEELGRITPRRAEEIYSAAVSRPNRKTGKPIAAATHRLYRNLAHGFYLWAVRKGYTSESPFRNVLPVGRPSAGKPQLTLDEAKRYRDAGLSLYDKHDDVMALAAVVPLYLGLRASEVLSRRVRDLDCDGTLLRIDRGKTRNARRYLAIKATALRSRLAKLAAKRPPDALLFCIGDRALPHTRQTLHAAVRRVCLAAGVPVVCPHSLRGLWATLGVESGAAEAAVASALGHSSFEMTARHYAQPEAVTDARSVRVAGFLDGGKPDDDILNVSANELIAKLPETTLAQLSLLLSRRMRGPVSA